MKRVVTRALAPCALLVLAGACATSPASELVRRAQGAAALGEYQVHVAIADPSTIFDCFPAGGTLTIAVTDDSVSVFDDPLSDPVLILDGDGLVLRPSAFSSGPNEWWAIEAPTNLRVVERLVGPVVAQLALGDEVERPNHQLVDLVGAAHNVERLGRDRFRIVDRNADPTVLDVTLDDHGHLVQLVVAAEDPRRPGRADDTRVSYSARYEHGAGAGEFQARPDRLVSADQLDTLDTRPGACAPTVGP